MHFDRAMGDDIKKTSPGEWTLVSMYEPYEVAYWTRRFGCTATQLEHAVKAVGGITTDVEEWLSRTYARP